MKWIFGSCVVGLCGALVSGGLSGCVAPERSHSTTVVRGADGRPVEIQPKPRLRGRPKQIEGEAPIVIAKAASPTPLAKGKKTARTRAKNAVPTGTNVPFDFLIESNSCPAGVQSVSTLIKCFEVTSLSNGTTPSIGVGSTAYSVFPGGQSSATPTLTPGTTTTLNLNFPSDTTAGKTLALIMTGSGYDANEDIVYFSGVQILVVNP